MAGLNGCSYLQCAGHGMAAAHVLTTASLSGQTHRYNTIHCTPVWSEIMQKNILLQHVQMLHTLTCMCSGVKYYYARVRFTESDLGGTGENMSHLPMVMSKPGLLLSHCLPRTALGQTCLLSGMERALKRWRDRVR